MSSQDTNRQDTTMRGAGTCPESKEALLRRTKNAVETAIEHINQADAQCAAYRTMIDLCYSLFGEHRVTEGTKTASGLSHMFSRLSLELGAAGEVLDDLADFAQKRINTRGGANDAD
jgi:hypothetical protein